MWWTYRMTAASEARLLMRVALLFDQQLLKVTRLLMMDGGEEVEISITVEADEKRARRIQAKLYGLQDVRTVKLSESITD